MEPRVPIKNSASVISIVETSAKHIIGLFCFLVALLPLWTETKVQPQVPCGTCPPSGWDDPSRGSNPCNPDPIAAINAVATRLVSYLGTPNPVPPILPSGTDGRGRHQDFGIKGAIYWNPNVKCAYFVYGSVRSKWNQHRAETGFLGYPLNNQMDTRYFNIKIQKFEGGSIVVDYNDAPDNAFEIHGLIREKWLELARKGLLGFPFIGPPISDEEGTPGVLLWSHCRDGSIYWTPYTSAHEIRGAIRDLWLNQLQPSGPNSWLGVPATDEKMMPDGKTPYQRFQNGIITYDWNQKKFVALPNPSEYPYFMASRVDLLFKEKLELGKPVTSNSMGNNLTGFQLYLESDNLIVNSIERHSDGSIYIAYSPRSSPFWYDNYNATESGSAEAAKLPFGAFGAMDGCNGFASWDPDISPFPNCDYFSIKSTISSIKTRNVDFSRWPFFEYALPAGRRPAPKWFKIKPRGGATASPGAISDFPPFGLPHETLPYTDDRGLYCQQRDLSDLPFAAIPCNPASNYPAPPEFATILPVNSSDGAKPYSWNQLKDLSQRDPIQLRDTLNWTRYGHPWRKDYCTHSVPWESSEIEGTVNNSFLSGVDYSGSHVGFPGKNYWLGEPSPKWFDSCGNVVSNKFDGPKNADCDDWIIYVQPDPEFQFLQMADVIPGTKTIATVTNQKILNQDLIGNYNLEHRGSLENEIEQWLLPVGFRTDPGDRIYMRGRWVVDCGHGDWHGELHPIEAFVSSHVEPADLATRPRAIGSIQVAAKVVVTGAWPGWPQTLLEMDVWPPARPSPTAVLNFQRQDPPGPTNFGFGPPLGSSQIETLEPRDNPNHVHLAFRPLVPPKLGGLRTHDYNQVYDPSGGGYDITRRVVTTYYLWWEEPITIEANPVLAAPKP